MIVATTFPRWKNDPGPAPFVFDLARHLLEYFDVSVLAPHHPGAAQEEEMAGLDVMRFRYFFPESREVLADGRGIQNNIRASLLGKIQAPLLLAAEYLAARRVLSRRRFPVVNSHWLIPSGLVMTALKKRFGFRHAVTVHAADYFLLRRVPAGRAMLRWILAGADVVLPVSSAIEAGLKDFIRPGSRMEVIPMAADLEIFKPADAADRERARERLGLKDSFVLLFVGKLSEKKGVEYLIRAAAGAHEKIPELKVLIIGEGHLKPSLEKAALKSGRAGIFEFLPPVPHEDLPAYYSASDALVVPSIVDRHGETEGMPVVILEALASGIPVIGTSCCAVPPELKRAGFFEIEPGDTEKLRAAIEELKSSAEVRVDASLIGRFSWRETSRRYADIFREAVERP